MWGIELQVIEYILLRMMFGQLKSGGRFFISVVHLSMANVLLLDVRNL